MCGCLRNTKAVVKRELKGYFCSPIAYVVLIIYLVLCGFLTFYVSQFYELRQADLSVFFQWHPWIYLFLVPAVSMRLWAEERRTGTIELVLTLPMTLTEVVLGKFLAAWLFLGIALTLTFPLPLTAAYLGDPDIQVIFCAYFGSLFMAGAYLSVGCVASALTRNQVISFVLSLIFCLFLVMAGWAPVTDVFSEWAPVWVVNMISGFSFITHFNAMARGVMDLRDIIYFGSVIGFMLFVNGMVLKAWKTA